ncbi:FG-GAP repeat domain-containing protein [Algoriphagus namhaensis]
MQRLLIPLFILGIILSCEPIAERKQPPPSLQQLAANQDLNLSARKLSEAYCGACHLMPEPEILDQNTWREKVLPDMRKRLGLVLPEDFGTLMPADMDVPKGIYSEAPMINEKNWDIILDYYLSNAPEQVLPQQKKTTPIPGMPLFAEVTPTFDQKRPDLTTLLKVDPTTGSIWLGSRFKKLYKLDPQRDYQVMDSISVDTAPVQLDWESSQQSFNLLTMGSMDPSNDSLGQVTQIQPGKAGAVKPIISTLMRPVNVSYADFNTDGKQDLVVCQFGNHLGKLSLFLSDGEGYQEKVLKALPGARRTLTLDFDGDGDLDILGLMTQANEGVFVWLNDGENNFVEKPLLRFQPAFGSSDFAYKDMDGDGALDLILVNGDNADQSQVLKSYHGLRVFLNDGEGKFEESWFYPVYGATGLEVEDFDQDGDLDIFVLAFFPNKNQKPGESLIYFEQKEKLDFQPFLSKSQGNQNWLSMTTGDVDLDGDLDVVVGSFAFNDLYRAPTENWSPIGVFINKTK